MSAVRHVFWDWNGTLLDDTQAALDTLNLMLARRGRDPIGMDFYRANFAFPVRPFYERIGVRVAQEDWDALAREYHRLYDAQPKRLNAETPAVLARVKALGIEQSIISALRQDLLEDITAHTGVRPYMRYLYGTDNLDGGSKLGRARELLAQVGGPEGVVLIGDALHDKEVADALGVRCVLCAQGGHAAERLRAVAPTGDTLAEALELALRPQDGPKML